MSTTSGTVANISQVQLGDELTADAAVGALVLVVDDVSAFSEAGGTLRLGTEVLAYVSVNDDASSISLAAATTQAHLAGERVDLWDASLSGPAVEWRALVQPPGDLDPSDAIDATVSHSLIPLLAEGIRDPGAGESVVLEQQGSEWVVTDIRGRTPKLDGSLIAPATIPQAALSFTFRSGTTATIAPNAPAAPAVGDVWYDTANGNRMNTWDGSAWGVKVWGANALDPKAVGAKTSIGTTPPIAPNDGDLWLAVDANGGAQMQRYSAASATWVGLTWNTDSIAANAITAGLINVGSLNGIDITSATVRSGTITGSMTGTMQGSVIGSKISGSDFVIDSDNGRILVYQQTATPVPLTGSGTYPVPPTANQIKVEAWGAGGGGGGGNVTGSTLLYGGGGGGGEYAAESSYAVTAGQQIPYSVGAAGAAGAATPTAGGNGGNTSFGTVLAHGGQGGGAGTKIANSNGNGTPGLGGTSSNNLIHYNGGNAVYGGGGGAGPLSAGGNAPWDGAFSGGAAVAGGSAGGASAFSGGGANPAVAAKSGGAPGGGGGGGFVNVFTNAIMAGAAGAAGKLQLTVYATTLVASIAAIPGTDALTGTAYPAGIKVYRADLVETPAPIGSILMFAGPTAPAGYLLCQGQLVSRTAYASLFGVIGTAYGVGDGANTFGLPDLRVRFPLGAGGRAAGPAGAAQNVALGISGGSDAHTHTFDDGGHTHTTPAHSHPLSANGGARVMLAAGGIAMDTGGVGSGFTTNWSATATGYARTSGPGTVGSPASNAALMGSTDNSAAGTSGSTHANGTTGTPSNGYPPYASVNYIIKT